MKRDNQKKKIMLMSDNNEIEKVISAMGRVFSFESPAILIPRQKHNRSKYSPHQGEEERAKRRRQIEKGQLTTSNGLVYNKVAS